MLPLSFPIVISEPRLFVQKLAFKLRVMRLNRIKLFYTFLLCFHSEHNKDGGIHLQAGPCRGSHPWLGRLQGRPYTAKAAYKRSCPWPARKGPTPIEAAPPAGTMPVGRPPTDIGSAHSGGACHKGGACRHSALTSYRPRAVAPVCILA
ncbi:hypothetical protein BHM03_00019166 [Ensete ventricosum]|nr:hypothetical protein BHM03_00019166 [Ensete ventricosum]